jgi:hypothetical protein
MSLFLTDFDTWYDDYMAASPQQQQQLLKAALSQPIDPAYASEIDLGLVIIEHQDLLLDHNRLDDLLELINLLQQQHPVFYQQEFPYYDSFLAQYYLHQNDIPQVIQALTRFQANPTKNVDELIEILEDLQFYSAIPPLIDLCRTVYTPIETSRTILSGTGTEFACIIFIDVVQNLYDQLQQNKPINWAEIKPQIEPYNFDLTETLQTELTDYLTAPLTIDPSLLTQFPTQRPAILRRLLFGFCRYMHDRHHMSFVCAQMIWATIAAFLAQRDLSPKQTATPDSYFTIDKTQLDQYILGKVTGFLSMQQSQGFGILWGIPHVYDFLLASNVITPKVHNQALTLTHNLKPKLTRVLSRSLWRYSFVHRWPKPDSITIEDFQAEAAQFTATFTQSTPLGDQAIEPERFNLPLPSMTHPAPPRLSLPTWQPQKTKKSHLQEAADLPKNPKNNKSKKSQRKGFG